MSILDKFEGAVYVACEAIAKKLEWFTHYSVVISEDSEASAEHKSIAAALLQKYNDDACDLDEYGDLLHHLQELVIDAVTEGEWEEARNLIDLIEHVETNKPSSAREDA